MRFSELVEVESTGMALSVLLSILEYLSSKKDKQPEVNTDSVVQMVQNAGVPFDFEIFKKLYDENQSVKNLVSDFNRHVISFDDSESDGDDSRSSKDDSADVVKGMAKQAMSNRK